MENKDKILDKIKKLLKLQHSAETLGNEGEAYAAANAVHRLLTTYNLSLSDVSESNEERADITESDEITYRSPYGSVWKRALLSTIATNNYCQVLVKPYKQHMLIVGQEDNVEIVKGLYSYLTVAFCRLSSKRMGEFSKELLSENTRLTKQGEKKFLSSYFIGAVDGLRRNFESRKPTSDETSLMVCHSAAIKDFLDKAPNYNGKNFKGKRQNNDLMPEGLIYGLRDGANISLNRQIKG
jgi:hypothetical protein